MNQHEFSKKPTKDQNFETMAEIPFIFLDCPLHCSNSKPFNTEL